MLTLVPVQVESVVKMLPVTGTYAEALRIDVREGTATASARTNLKKIGGAFLVFMIQSPGSPDQPAVS